MSRQLRDGVKYTNTCYSCPSTFISYGWMKKYCRNCLPVVQEELAKVVKDKGLISFKAYTQHILKKFPQIGYGHCGLYKGVYCQSTWELAVAIWAFSEGLSIIRSPLVIYYKFEGRQHRYHPDFEIDGKTYEIKGWVNPKALAKQEYAKSQGIDIIFIDERACEFYFEYAYSKYGMDPRTNWVNFYDKEITPILQPTKSPKFKKYPLHAILLEKDNQKQKELLLDSSFIFRDKEILQRYIQRAENEANPVHQHIKDLKKAQVLLYPNS